MVQELEIHLDSLEKKFELIKDRVRGVALGIDTGFFLYGPGGVGKTYTVVTELKRLRTRWKLLNSDITAPGLFDFMSDFSDHVIVLDDMEHLYQDKKAIGFLRSATWGDKTITKTNDNGRFEFKFKGGIIILSNLSLGESQPLTALATRMSPAEFIPTEHEKMALMWKIAREGKPDLTPEVCGEVLDFFLSYCQRIKYKSLDLRLFEHALNARKMFEAREVRTHWKDLIVSRLQQKIITPMMPLNPRKMQVLDLKSIAKDLFEKHPSNETARCQEWIAITGKSETLLKTIAADLGLTINTN